MILLDTHAWIWHIGQRASLSEAARRRIDQEETAESLLISAISVWELFLLVKRGRLDLSVRPATYLTVTHRDPLFHIVPVDETVARRSVELADIHADPADRMILATAVELGVPVVSKDSRFHDYQAAEVIW